MCPDDGAALVLIDTNAATRADNLIDKVVDGRYKIERIVGRAAAQARARAEAEARAAVLCLTQRRE